VEPIFDQAKGLHVHGIEVYDTELLTNSAQRSRQVTLDARILSVSDDIHALKVERSVIGVVGIVERFRSGCDFYRYHLISTHHVRPAPNVSLEPFDDRCVGPDNEIVTVDFTTTSCTQQRATTAYHCTALVPSSAWVDMKPLFRCRPFQRCSRHDQRTVFSEAGQVSKIASI